MERMAKIREREHNERLRRYHNDILRPTGPDDDDDDGMMT